MEQKRHYEPRDSLMYRAKADLFLGVVSWMRLTSSKDGANPTKENQMRLLALMVLVASHSVYGVIFRTIEYACILLRYLVNRATGQQRSGVN